MKEIEVLREMAAGAGNIVFFGGAGVSTESGIPDFRSVDGLYHQTYKYPPEVMLSEDFFYGHTEEFFRFYFDKLVYTDAKPNAAHTALAALEKKGKLKAVVTQNIDGLHQTAGSRNVFELHGSVLRNYCVRCSRFYSLEEMLAVGGGIPKCACGGIVKPAVVLYGEQLPQRVLDGAVKAISKCDLLIVGGTSLQVYPAAGLVRYAPGKIVLINKTATGYDGCADLVLRENISILKEIV